MKIKVLSSFYQRRIKEKTAELFSPEFTNDLAVRILIVGAAFLMVVIWLVALFSFKQANYPVPLRYNSFLGVTELGPWYKLYRIPVITVVLFFINTCLAGVMFKKDRMIGYIFLGITVFVSIMSLAVVVNLSLLLRS